MGKFEMLCGLLPADVNWGDAITPDVVEQIVIAERNACVEAVKAEHLECATDSDGDDAYDNAIRHATAAIMARSNA